MTLVARVDGVERRIACGRGAWQKGRLAWGRLPEQPAAASGGWTGDDTFTAKLCFYETPFIVTVRLKFAGDEVRLDSEANVGFGPTKQPQLVGTSSAKPRDPEASRRPAPEASGRPALGDDGVNPVPAGAPRTEGHRQGRQAGVPPSASAAGATTSCPSQAPVAAVHA